MTRVSQLSVLIGLILVAACTVRASGPEPPRPRTPPATTTSLPPITTTTLDPADVMAAKCPTEFCLVYTLNPNARWSDGSPITSADFADTADFYRNPPVGDPGEGYDLISDIENIDETRFRVDFASLYGPWQGLFSRLIPPDIAPTDPDPDNLLSSGPFQIKQQVAGDSLVVDRVGEWWSDVEPISGKKTGTVNQITFQFFNDPSEVLTAMEEGLVDVASLPADSDTVARLTSNPNLEFALSPGPFWEHIDFQHGDPLLANEWARQAIAMSIDRQKILDQTVRLIDPTAQGLDNTMYMGGTVHYEAHFSERFDPAAAEGVLRQHGCERGDDDIYVCGQRPMSFVWATIDDPTRRATFASVQEDLAAVGIDVVADFRTPSAFVASDHLFGGPDVWQLANFSWRAVADPGSSMGIYMCGNTGRNVNGYCSERVDDLLNATTTRVDPVQRAAAFNEADQTYLDDLAVIPLYQRLDLLAWNAAIEGPQPNHTMSSNLWNVVSWTPQTSIVVALGSEPIRLDMTTTLDDDINAVLATLLYGAYGMSPDQRPTPVLIDSVNVIKN